MKTKVWILEVGDANNISYDATYTVYKTYEEAHQEMINQYKDKVNDYKIDLVEEQIKEYIEDPDYDAYGNIMMSDEYGEFYLKIIEGNMED